MLLRKHGVASAYDRIKKLTRGQAVSKKNIDEIIDQCKEFTKEDIKRLKSLSPQNYLGIAKELALGEIQSVSS